MTIRCCKSNEGACVEKVMMPHQLNKNKKYIKINIRYINKKEERKERK
jgi:hypothetical protein